MQVFAKKDEKMSSKEGMKKIAEIPFFTQRHNNKNKKHRKRKSNRKLKNMNGRNRTGKLCDFLLKIKLND